MALLFNHYPQGSVQGTGDFVFRHYGAEMPIGPPYLCFTAEQANSTITMQAVGSAPSVSLETSTDKVNWLPFTVGSTTITLANIGDKIYFRGDNTTFATDYLNHFNRFVMTGKITSSGNIMSLLDANNFENNTAISSDYCFAYLFNGCTSLTSAPELPATTLAAGCYYSMFYNCTSLTSAPELPATILADYCYLEMFSGCTGIKLSQTQGGIYTTPYRIPTTGTGTTADDSMYSMFADTGGSFKGTPTINRTYYGAW